MFGAGISTGSPCDPVRSRGGVCWCGQTVRSPREPLGKRASVRSSAGAVDAPKCGGRSEARPRHRLRRSPSCTARGSARCRSSATCGRLAQRLDLVGASDKRGGWSCQPGRAGFYRVVSIIANEMRVRARFSIQGADTRGSGGGAWGWGLIALRNSIIPRGVRALSLCGGRVACVVRLVGSRWVALSRRMVRRNLAKGAGLNRWGPIRCLGCA